MTREQIIEKKDKTKITRDLMKIGITEIEKKIETIRITDNKKITNHIGITGTIMIEVEDENKDKYYKKPKKFNDRLYMIFIRILLIYNFKF